MRKVFVFVFFIFFIITPPRAYAIEGSCINYKFPTDIPAPKNVIKSMTFNVMFAHYDDETGRDTESHMKQIAHVIKQENLDVVLLQEMEYISTSGDNKFYCPTVNSSACCVPYKWVDPSSPAPPFPHKNAFEYLIKELNALGYPMFYANGNYVAGNLTPQKSSGWHAYNSTLSRYPIVKTIPHQTSTERVVFRTDINVGGKLVSFYNLHIRGSGDMDFVWGLFVNGILPYNAVLIGDFNIGEDLAKNFSNSSRDVNYYLNPFTGPTFGMLDGFFVRKSTFSQGLGVSDLATRTELMVEGSHAPTIFNLDISKVPSNYTPYDVNIDNVINITDILELLKILFYSKVFNYSADVNNNGLIDISDVIETVVKLF